MQPHKQSTPSEEHQPIQYHELEVLFPQTLIFALNLALGTLIHLYMDEHVHYPLVLGEQQFSERERDLLWPLFTHYPQWVPYEMIHTSFYPRFDRLSEQLIAQAQTMLMKSMFSREQSSTHIVLRDGHVKRSG